MYIVICDSIDDEIFPSMFAELADQNLKGKWVKAWMPSKIAYVRKSFLQCLSDC